MEFEISVFPGQVSDEKSIQISESVFGQPYNEPLIHQVLTAYMAGGRAGTKAQKTRAQVRGGGAKPWRQKGTGRARSGTIRSPLWRKGGKSFAAVPREFDQKVNRKMYEGAMRSIWSELMKQGRLIVLNDFKLNQPKTRELLQKLTLLKIEQALIVHDDIDSNLLLAVRNLYKVQLCSPEVVNPADLIAFEKIVLTVRALKQIEERLQ